MKTYQEFVNENSKYTKHVKAIQNWNDKADVRGMIKQIPLNRKNFQKKRKCTL